MLGREISVSLHNAFLFPDKRWRILITLRSGGSPMSFRCMSFDSAGLYITVDRLQAPAGAIRSILWLLYGNDDYGVHCQHHRIGAYS